MVRMQALYRDPPQAADSIVCEAGRRTCSEHETGTEELCDQVDQVGLHIVGTKPSEAYFKGTHARDFYSLFLKFFLHLSVTNKYKTHYSQHFQKYS